MLSTDDIVDRFRRCCADAGFDLVQPFATSWWTEEPTLPAFGDRGSLAVVVANSGALWPKLCDALRREPSRIDASEHIVDVWAVESVEAAARATAIDHRILWAHALGAEAVPIQRIAQVAGLAWLSPANLSIHPRFGPWIGLRAVVIFDLPIPDTVRPRVDDPCGHCDQACLPAFTAAREGPAGWRSWLAIRDACPLGREHRYSEDQIAYHYTKDRDILRSAAGAAD